MKKFDFSVHFTIKDQSLDDINKKLDDWLVNNKSIMDLSERDINEPRIVLHHCFLPREIVVEKGFDTKLIDSLDELSEDQVRWFNCGEGGLGMSRLLMLQNLKRLSGVALFIGELKEGVKEEYELAVQIGVECILIN